MVRDTHRTYTMYIMSVERYDFAMHSSRRETHRDQSLLLILKADRSAGLGLALIDAQYL